MTEALSLRIALVLNLALAGFEIVAGLAAKSVALLVDAADFLEDSVIYALALRLGGRELVDERRYGLLIAGLMALPGLVALWQLIERFLGAAAPDGGTIWKVSVLALVANLVSAFVIGLARHGRAEGAGLGLQAAWLSSRNDALANIAMIAAGVMVVRLNAGWPDTVVGLGIAVLHFSGAVAVARLALAGKTGP